jgi:malate synthase
MNATRVADGIEVVGSVTSEFAEILTNAALEFIAGLHRAFEGRRHELLKRRARVQAELDGGWLPDFPAETRAIRGGGWTVGPTPDDLLDRHVELTGPVDRKMVINALNSGARMYMADFEDARGPGHRTGPEDQHQRWTPLPRELAARVGLRPHLQPDGGHGDL